MEASDTSGSQEQPDQNDGTQDSGQSTADSSQEQSQEDSQLTTPQPDQSIPAEGQRAETAPDAAQAAQPTQDQSASDPGVREAPRGVQPPDARDQHAEAVQRENELAADRRAHNERTGGGEVQDGEVQVNRQEHNDRTGGGQVPGANEVQSDFDGGPIDRGE